MKKAKKESYVLLKIDPTLRPIYFILRREDFGHTPESDAYFFNEHTCPVNWLGDVVEVVAETEVDPHGFARFVRRVPVDPEEDGEPDWEVVFPEAFEP